MHWLILVAALLAVGALILLLFLRATARPEWMKRFDEVLRTRKDLPWEFVAETEEPQHMGILSKTLHQQPSSQTVNALRQAGWYAPYRRSMYYTVATISPLAGLFLGLTWGGLTSYSLLLAAFIGFAVGYLLPPRVLAWVARRRQKALQNEMLATLHLLRMLLDAGLSLEHTLRVLSEQGKELVPNLAEEFRYALARIGTGQEQAEALTEMAVSLDVPELSDTIAILRQAGRFGGNLRDTLTTFAQLTEERRMTGLREYVSKLSAKMTLVMILFMFPALMLFLAGPGFLALAKAMQGMQ